ncbi:hypothetical protein [Virgibacillus halodenitrificans]|uniref:hypothetical protein n=1 Tax=Virgibacillus halodenitrificans TaxID=1482 RepID=UPI000761C34D|nr:hypothetical protein [Virgibacillus halodenitrificans]MCJ0930193.1 hypothetical protein [Virgibacillus halodenitrificans]
MRPIALLLSGIHIFILYLWLANSSLLFSQYGITVWMFIVVLSMIVIYKMRKTSAFKLTLFVSTSVMLSLAAVTIAIHFIISTML